MNTNITVEICVENLAGAKAAVEAGVPRIELCSALDLGGVTPDAALLESVLALPIETVVLIRPRAGDFVFDADEVKLMQRSIELARAQGARAFAIGALNPDGSIDETCTAKLVTAAGDSTLCFHRAFDGVSDAIGSLQVLTNLGITRLLTSGQKQDAWAGAPLIAQLIEAAPASLEIMPGGGVRANTIGEILEITGAQQIHFSARAQFPSPMKHANPACDLHAPENRTRRQTTAQEIERYLAKIR